MFLKLIIDDLNSILLTFQYISPRKNLFCSFIDQTPHCSRSGQAGLPLITGYLRHCRLQQLDCSQHQFYYGVVITYSNLL